MALLQALFSLLSRSLGKVLNAVFGWAVVALFGQTTPAQQTLLSGLVGLAAAWPVLLLGAVFPRIGTLLIAFVPRAVQGPPWLMRLIWLGVTEDLARSVALLTLQPAAQELEARIRRVWAIHDENPAAHRGSPALQRRLDDLVGELAEMGNGNCWRRERPWQTRTGRRWRRPS